MSRHRTDRRVACSAYIVFHWRVRLWGVHAESELVVHAQIPCSRSIRDTRVRIVDYKRVRRDEERDSRTCLVSSSVPSHSLRGPVDGLVHGNGVRGRVRRAGGKDVDCGGRGFERGEVPCKGDVVLNLVVLRARHDIGRDHRYASCW